MEEKKNNHADRIFPQITIIATVCEFIINITFFLTTACAYKHRRTTFI